MLKRWQSPLALLLVFLFTHWAYTRMMENSATIVEEKDEGGQITTSQYVKAKILSIAQSVPEDQPNTRTDVLEAKLLGGQFKGQRVLLRNTIHERSVPLLNINASVGDVVLVRVGGSGQVLGARNLVQDYNRDGFIVALLGVLMAVVILIGRDTGIRAVLTMVVNGGVLYYFMLPLIHRGYNPVWTVVLTCAVISASSRIIVAGFGRKTYAAILGTIGGVVVAGFVVLYGQSVLHFTGVEKANAADIIESGSAAYLDFAGLLIAGMLIGLLGIANDAAIEVASAMEEVNEANPNLTIPQLMQSGMNVGTDILGTMANTVLFVYFGFRLLIVLALVGTDTIPATNMELLSIGAISSEIMRVLAGTLGLVITIPLTAGISGLFHTVARKKALA